MKLIEIFNWAEERGLNDQKPDRNGFCAFIAEEIGEAVEASIENDIHGYIDACCDIVVFAAGDMYKRKFNVDKYLGDTIDISEVLSNSYYEDKTNHYLFEINYLLYNFLEAKNPDQEATAMKNMVIASGREVEMLGYDFSKCMDEVMKEINSRVGSYDPEVKKWIKDKSPEAQAKWYKADFSKCKRV